MRGGQHNKNRPASNASALRRPAIVRDDVVYVPLTKGRIATLDVADLALVEGVNWHADTASSGHVYAVKRVGGKARRRIHMHRLIMGNPEGMLVDHIDGDTLNNRRSNLRVVTASQNKINRAINCNNTSGVKGVSFVQSRDRWYASIHIDGKSKALGWFKTKEQAAVARLKAEAELHGEFARRHAQT